MRGAEDRNSDDEDADDEDPNDDGALWWDEPDEERRGYIVLQDAIEGISGHFHEHHDVIMGWSWKLFCSKWARTLEAASRRQAQQTVRDARSAAKRRRDRQARQEAESRAHLAGLARSQVAAY